MNDYLESGKTATGGHFSKFFDKTLISFGNVVKKQKTITSLFIDPFEYSLSCRFELMGSYSAT